MEDARGVSVDAERLADIDILPHLDFHVLGFLVEQVQDGHQGHGRIDVAGIDTANFDEGGVLGGGDIHVRETVEHGHLAHDTVVVGVGVHGTEACSRLGEFGEDVVKKVLGFDIFGLVDLAALEGGAETDFLGAHFAAQLAPLRFVLVSLGVAEYVADDGVPAFLDSGNEHGVVVVVGENFRVGGIPGGVRGDVPENLKYLVRLFLAEVGGLEHNIETDGGRVTLAQVLDYVGVHVAVPFVKGT